MIVPDVNLVVYAHNRSVPQHDRARLWWERCLNGTEPVGLAVVVVLGFVRLLSNPRVVTAPVAPDLLVRTAARWLDCPAVRLVGPGPRHFGLVERLFRESGATSTLTTDVHLAALALELGAELHSNDTDFLRFSGLTVVNPLVR